jgi:hypothetical protein
MRRARLEPLWANSKTVIPLRVAAIVANMLAMACGDMNAD